MNFEKLLTIQEAASLLGLSERKVKSMIARRQVDSIKLGHSRRIRLSALARGLSD